MSEKSEWFGTENSPYINQFIHLSKAAFMWLLWKNGPSHEATDFIPRMGLVDDAWSLT